nr:RHS repeat domain-containing protein [Prevotella histicola]
MADIRTYVYGATYDSWNRVQTMTYPDGEVVTYHYNAAGQVESLTSNKQDAALGQYLVTRPNGLSYKITDELEELQTTGIKSIFINSSKATSRKSQFTENILRKEHGYNERVEY